MRKRIFCLALLLAGLVLSPSGAQAGASARWFAGETEIPLTEAVRRMSEYDVVLFGEYHDQPSIHETELAFLTELEARVPKLALSLEMFECDIQALMDQYLRGEVSEAEFLQGARPWKNYRDDYRPLVSFAKARGVDVIASNLPRRVAAFYAKNGSLSGVDADDAQYLPRVHTPGGAAYEQMFSDYMQSGQTGMAMTQAKIRQYFLAQSLKDDRMAQSIADYAAAHAGGRILHVQGEFHGRAHLGVAEKLRRIAPALKIAVIEPVFLEGGVQETVKRRKDDGDLLLFINERQSFGD